MEPIEEKVEESPPPPSSDQKAVECSPIGDQKAVECSPIGDLTIEDFRKFEKKIEIALRIFVAGKDQRPIPKLYLMGTRVAASMRRNMKANRWLLAYAIRRHGQQKWLEWWVNICKREMSMVTI